MTMSHQIILFVFVFIITVTIVIKGAASQLPFLPLQYEKRKLACHSLYNMIWPIVFILGLMTLYRNFDK
jgi:hypothetical protein